MASMGMTVMDQEQPVTTNELPMQLSTLKPDTTLSTTTDSIEDDITTIEAIQAENDNLKLQSKIIPPPSFMSCVWGFNGCVKRKRKNCEKKYEECKSRSMMGRRR